MRGSSKINESSRGKEIISLEECKDLYAVPGLTDEQLSTIRNSMIGIIDCLINIYLDKF